MEFIEAPVFTRQFPSYLDDEQYRAMQEQLLVNPEAGVVMPNTGGFRKMRWADLRRGKGRRGGLRIIYYYFEADKQIWFMTLYNKDEAADLNAGEKKLLRKAIDAEIKVRDSRRRRTTRRTE